MGLRRAGRARADRALMGITQNPRFEIVFGSHELHLAGFEVLSSFADLRLSYADAVGLALARERGITEAFTLDQAWAACGVTPIS